MPFTEAWVLRVQMKPTIGKIALPPFPITWPPPVVASPTTDSAVASAEQISMSYMYGGLSWFYTLDYFGTPPIGDFAGNVGPNGVPGIAVRAYAGDDDGGSDAGSVCIFLLFLASEGFANARKMVKRWTFSSSVGRQHMWQQGPCCCESEWTEEEEDSATAPITLSWHAFITRLNHETENLAP